MAPHVKPPAPAPDLADAPTSATGRPIRPRTWRVARRIAWSAAGLMALGSAGLAAVVVMTWHDTPEPFEAAAKLAARATRIISSDGVLLQELGDTVHEPITLNTVAPALQHALLATEDKRFYQHGGLDLRRITASAWATLCGDMQGASTLTQQLARNLFPQEVGRERSLQRKLREMVVAIKLERAHDKPTLLQMYLNQVPYLYNVVGVGAAARTYFGKPASALEAHEAALLVAMLKGPAQYDPQRHPERALARRNLVLAQMERAGTLDAGEAQRARARPLGVQVARLDTRVPVAPHYMRLVRQELAAWAERQGVDLQRDGLVVRVGLDTRQQALAERAVDVQSAWLQRVADAEWSQARLREGAPAKGAVANPFAHFWRQNAELQAELASSTPAYRQVQQQGGTPAQALAAGLRDPALRTLQDERTRIEAGFVALEPRTGVVRAYVGSRDFERDAYDHVAQARRQPGSTFKPFVYGAALLAGMTPEDRFVDEVHSYVTADGQSWAPTDAGGASGMPITLRTALASSRNTVTAQVMQAVGPERVARLARAMGVDRSPLQPVPSLALGTSPVTLLEMASAYGTLAALGQRRTPVLIERIEDARGRLLHAADAAPLRVVDEPQATLLVDMLRDVVDGGTGQALRRQFAVKGDLAGKTGTTQKNTDGWFIAMHPSLVAGAWVGFNDQRVTMRSTRWGQGGQSALRLVGDYLSALQKQGLMPLGARFPAVVRPVEPPMIEDAAQAVGEDVLPPRQERPAGDMALVEAPPARLMLARGGEPAAREMNDREMNDREVNVREVIDRVPSGREPPAAGVPDWVALRAAAMSHATSSAP